jgi:hypothetical protein
MDHLPSGEMPPPIPWTALPLSEFWWRPQLWIFLLDRAKQLAADWRSGNVTKFAKKTFILRGPLAQHGIDVEDVLKQVTR